MFLSFSLTFQGIKEHKVLRKIWTQFQKKWFKLFVYNPEINFSWCFLFSLFKWQLSWFIFPTLAMIKFPARKTLLLSLHPKVKAEFVTFDFTCVTHKKHSSFFLSLRPFLLPQTKHAQTHLLFLSPTLTLYLSHVYKEASFCISIDCIYNEFQGFRY